MENEITKAVVTSWIEKAITFVVASIWKHVCYVLNYKDNVQNLKSKVEALRQAKTRVMHDVKAARKRLEEIEEDVQSWLTSVDEEIAKAEKILTDDEAASKSCCLRLLPNVKTRHRFSRKAKEETPVVEELAGRGNFDRVGNPVPPKGLVPSKSYEAFESREAAFNSVVGALQDSEINVVGVWGLGGVGKTTMVNKVMEQVLAEGMFERVAKTEVTANPDPKKIQTDIAEWLGFKIEAESSIEVRASLLYKRLELEKSVLVILDNVWNRLNLEAVGIPTSGGDTKKNACKILITTRNKQVLFDMGAGQPSCIQLNALSKEEAQKLFYKNAGDPQDLEIQSIASEIGTRCGGLPVLILPVATALKNRELYEWRDARARLDKFDNKDEQAQAYEALELSYSFLGGEAKSVFLLCGKFAPVNIKISHLLRHSFTLGLFKQCKTLQATRNRLLKVVNEILSSSLLLEGDTIERFRMHDVVHSFAISTLSKDLYSLAVSHGTTLEEWPARELLQGYTTISLLFCKIPELPMTLECPKLVSFLLWVQRGHSTKLSNSIFREMRELIMLDLVFKEPSPLPSSFKLLKNLQSLLLYDCMLEDISIIGELKNLQILHLGGSTIVHLPRQIEKLTRLRLLDLIDCKKLRVIPAGILSCLTQLEELYMGDSFQRWGQGNNAKLAELKDLPNLITLDIRIKDAKMLFEDIFIENLERFRVYVGHDWDRTSKYENARTLKLELDKSFRWVKKVRSLLKRTETLYLDGLGRIGKDLRELDMDGFPQLKHLHMQNCHGIRHIVSSMLQVNTPIAFPQLESFHIENSQDLENICNGLLTNAALNNLRELKVASCNSIKSFFPISSTNGLSRLEKIEVTDCKMMEEIFINDTHGEKEAALEFTQLRKLTLQRLPHLTSFCSGKVKASSLRHTRTSLATGSSFDQLASTNKSNASLPLFNENILFPNLEDLQLSLIKVQKIWDDQLQDSFMGKLTSIIVSKCDHLRYLFTSSLVESLTQLKVLEIAECRSMEEIIIVDSQGKEKMMSKMIFPKLESLKLKRLPKIITVCTTESIKFPKLKEFLVEDCHEMKTCSSSSLNYGGMAISNDMEMMNLTLFDNKILFPMLEDLKLFSMNVQKIWDDQLQEFFMGKLTSMVVSKCDHLKYLFTSSLVESLAQLKVLEIADCRSMEEIIIVDSQGKEKMMIKMVFPKLESLKLKQLPKVITVCTTESIEFPKLKEFFVEDCHEMKTFNFSSLSYGDMTIENDLKLINSTLFDNEILFPTFEDLKLLSINVQKIWDNQLQESYSFLEKLTSLVVSDCDNLRHLLTSSMVESLVQLKVLEIVDCMSMEEIIIIETQGIGTTTSKMVFPKLESFKLKRLRKLITVCSSDSIECPKLKELCVIDCVELKILNSNSLSCGDMTINNDREMMNSILFDNKILFPNLEDLELSSIKVQKIWDDQLRESYSFMGKLTSLVVSNCENLRYLFTSSMVESLAQLKTLQIADCKSMEEIIILETQGEGKMMSKMVFPKLKSLKLKRLRKLITICISDSIECPMLDELLVADCHEMKTFNSGYLSYRDTTVNNDPEMLNPTLFDNKIRMPKSEAVLLREEMIWYNQLIKLSSYGQNLTRLLVDSCENMNHLFGSSVVECLVQLKRLEIWNCKFMEQVVLTTGLGEKKTMSRIIFSQLNFLGIKDLPKLTRFCVDTTIECPVLKVLSIENCPKLDQFVSRSVGIDAPTSSESINTNSVLFDEKVLFPNLEKLVLSYVDNLKMIWCDKIPVDSFYKLRTIRITHAEQLFKIFPSNLLRRFENVQEISIKNCCFLEEVFDIQELARVEDSDAVLATKLKTLEIDNVQRLKHVWNGDPQEIADFQDLQSVRIGGCQNLKALFPASVAKSLPQLEVLSVRECGVEEIVGGDEGGEEIAFHFPRVKLLRLFDLPELKCFYPGVHSLKFPVLEDLRVFHCPNVEIFASEPQNPQEMHMESQHEVQFQQPFLSFVKVIPNLNLLSLRGEDAIKLCQSSTSEKSFHKVKCLWLECVHDSLSDFPFDLLQRFENLEHLIMRGCSHFKEVFRCEILSEKKHARSLTHIQFLTLDLLPGLRVLWNQEAPMVQVFQSLEGLSLCQCDSLIYLEPSLASLQNLTYLDLWRCQGLVSIMKLSTAPVLVRLQFLVVRECNRVTEIVSDEGEEAKDNITFRKLKSLTLDTLTSLSNFCSAPVAIKFPNLDEVKLSRCHKMKAFSQGMVSTPKLESVIFTERTEKKRWKGNLNTTIKHWYSQMNAENLDAEVE